MARGYSGGSVSFGGGGGGGSTEAERAKGTKMILGIAGSSVGGIILGFCFYKTMTSYKFSKSLIMLAITIVFIIISLLSIYYSTDLGFAPSLACSLAVGLGTLFLTGVAYDYIGEKYYLSTLSPQDREKYLARIKKEEENADRLDEEEEDRGTDEYVRRLNAMVAAGTSRDYAIGHIPPNWSEGDLKD